MEHNRGIVIIGDIWLDRYYIGDVNRVSPEAPVPVLLVKKSRSSLGGAANIARNIAALGHRATLLGVVGADEVAQEIEQVAHNDGVTTCFTRYDRIETGVRIRLIGRSQQLLHLELGEKEGETLPPIDFNLFEKALTGAQVLVVADQGRGGDEIQRLISAAKMKGLIIVVDPGGADFQYYAGATVVMPNLNELSSVIGQWSTETDLHARAQTLRRELQCEAIVLTRSAEGMTLFTEEESTHFHAERMEVYDVSGVGETVVAALAVKLAEGAGLPEAVVAANRAAGVVISKSGTATLTMKELKEAEAT